MPYRKEYEEIDQAIAANSDALLRFDLPPPFKGLITEGFDPNDIERTQNSTWGTPKTNKWPFESAVGVDERPSLLMQPNHDLPDTPKAANNIGAFGTLLPTHNYRQPSSSWSKKVSEGTRCMTIALLCSLAISHLSLNGVFALLEGMAVMLVGTGIIPCLFNLGKRHFDTYFNDRADTMNATAVNGEGILGSRCQPRARTMKKANWLQAKYNTYNIYNFKVTKDSDSDSSMDSCVGWYRNPTPTTPTTTAVARKKNFDGNAYVPGQLSPEPVERRFRPLRKRLGRPQRISFQGKYLESSADEIEGEEEEGRRGRDRKVKRLSISRKLRFNNRKSGEHHDRVLSGEGAGFSVSEDSDSFFEPRCQDEDESFNVDLDTMFINSKRTEAQSPSLTPETGGRTTYQAGTRFKNHKFQVKGLSSREAKSGYSSD